MTRVVVIGSGASGVHFALTALEKGHDVLMLDVGHPGPEPIRPADDLATLKRTLADPAGYFLGEQFESVLFPDDAAEYYGFPPSKTFVFRPLARPGVLARGFAPLMSFARGGLAEAWTAGAYPLNDAELRPFPFGYDELQPYYSRIAVRIGINGEADDLARFFPVPSELQAPLRLDEHADRLLSRYQRQRQRLNATGCYVGRSRVATLSRDLGNRQACTYSGRCLWGCPNGALYTPALTLRECLRHPRFRYRPGVYVRSFDCGADRRIATVACEDIGTGEPFAVPADLVALAAGTLMSTKIFLESYRRATGRAPRLGGLMDNRQIMVPFVNLGMVGRRFNPASYQYHQLAMGLAEADPASYVHCQITTLKTALIHPIVQGAPFDLRTSVFLFRHLHAALGLVNVNLHDTRREDNSIALETDPGASEGRLVVRYRPPTDEPSRIRRVIGRVKRALWALGCVVPPGMTRVRPMGASVHYAGTIPMTTADRPLTATPDGRSRDFPNLLFADGTTFPSLPAKNLTYTLMANAARVADRAIGPIPVIDLRRENTRSVESGWLPSRCSPST